MLDKYSKRRTYNPLLENVLENIYTAASNCGMSLEESDFAVKSEKILRFNIPIEMDDLSKRIFEAFYVQHSTDYPSLGSISIVNAHDINYCEALAIMSTIHSSMLDIPFGGSKGIIVCDPNDLSSQEISKLYRGFINEISVFLLSGKSLIKIINDTDTSIYPMISEVSKYNINNKIFTNLPADLGGNKYSSCIHSICISECVRNILSKFCQKSIEDIKVGITIDSKHFDKKLLSDLCNLGLKIGSVQDTEFNCECGDSKDLYDIVEEYKMEVGQFIRNVNGIISEDTNQNVLSADVDILILQAPDVRINIDNAKLIKAKYIIEAEEELISCDAERYLESKGIIIVPDFISLSGILVNSYIEYSSSSNFCTYENYKDTVKMIIGRSLDKLWEVKEMYNVGTRTAAFIIAIQKIVNNRMKKLI